MICLRCGYCCKNYFVIIVNDSEKGLIEGNLICHEGKSPCQHLAGDKPGEYACKIHDKKWYKKTPCFTHGQIEASKDCVCRMGKFVLKSKDPNIRSSKSLDQVAEDLVKTIQGIS